MLASKISIKDLLEVVKSTHHSILPEDVLAKLGETRSQDGYYSSRVKFSVDDTDSQNDIGAMQAELYHLKDQRKAMLEADTDYAVAADNLRYANTFIGRSPAAYH